MADVLASLRRYMPEWMAQKGAELLSSLPPKVEQWVQQTAEQVEGMPVAPDRNAWRDPIVERFCQERAASEHEAVVDAIRSAVLLVAIQQLPPPESISDPSTDPDPQTTPHTKTKKLDRVAVKRSRMLGLLEKGLHASVQW